MVRERRASVVKSGIVGTAKVLSFDDVGEGNDLDAIPETTQQGSSSDSEGAQIVQKSDGDVEGEEDTELEVSVHFFVEMDVFSGT